MSANLLLSVPNRKRTQQEICDDWNARRERMDVHWYVHDGQIKIGWVR
jgi:hypothetical protein